MQALDYRPNEVARAIQFFAPGIPQVYKKLISLMEFRNSYEADLKTHDFTITYCDEVKEKECVLNL